MALIHACINRVVNQQRLEDHSIYIDLFQDGEVGIAERFEKATADAIGYEVGDLRLHCVKAFGGLHGLNRIERSLDVVFGEDASFDQVKGVVRKFADLIDSKDGDLRYGGIHIQHGGIRISFVGNHMEEMRRKDEARYMAEALLCSIEGNKDKIYSHQ